MHKVEYHAALPFSEVPAFMAELRGHDAVAARALEFAILTGARTGEVTGACWSEIDLEARTWTVLAARMKGGRENRVPLSEPAVAILMGMAEIRSGEFVFPSSGGAKPRSNMALLRMLRLMGRGDVTAHGFPDDPDKVRIVLPALLPTFLNDEQLVALGKADGSLSDPPGDACPCRYRVHTKPADALLGNLVTDDPQDPELTCREACGEG